MGLFKMLVCIIHYYRLCHSPSMCDILCQQVSQWVTYVIRSIGKVFFHLHIFFRFPQERFSVKIVRIFVGSLNLFLKKTD
jgi:hypothetical protein